MFWRLLRPTAQERQKLPTVRGKPVYIGGVLMVGVAERGEFDLRRRKLVAIEVKDAGGRTYRLDTSSVKVKISRESVDLDAAALPAFFELKMREVNSMVEELKRARAEIEKSYSKLEDALVRGVIGMDVYNEQVKRLQERERRLRAACVDMEKGVVSVGQSLGQLRAELERRRERLEAKRLLEKLEPGEAEELARVMNTLGSIDALSQLLTSTVIQLRLVC